MVPPPEIKNLAELIEPNLDGAKLISYSQKYLTKPGDNYGSTILSVTAVVQKDAEEPTTLELVAKLPPSSPAFFSMFQAPLTCVKENLTYEQIASTLINFQKERNVHRSDIIDFFPKCYGARNSLDAKAKLADTDSLLLLENLKFQGFTIGQKDIGFDEETTLLILQNLAKLHAVPIAIRYLNPELFQEKINPILNKVELLSGMSAEMIENMLFTPDITHIPELSHLITRFINQIEANKVYQSSVGYLLEDKPFTTLVHNDFWVNNVMISRDTEGKPTNIKIVDFQLTLKDSFAHDLIFFLLSSVQTEIINEKIDYFIEFYYQHFYNCLAQMGCPLDDFTQESFMTEIQKVAPQELFHVIFMLKVLMVEHDSMPEEFKDDNNNLEGSIGEKYYNKIKDVVLLMEKKGWIF